MEIQNTNKHSQCLGLFFLGNPSGHPDIVLEFPLTASAFSLVQKKGQSRYKEPVLPWYYRCPLFLALAKRRKKDDEEDEEAPEGKKDEEAKDTTSER